MRLLALIAVMLGLTSATAQTGPPEHTVDLELVLAVDISYSMDADELRLQRDGYMTAITSPQVIDAIKQGTHGRIAVAYIEWAGVENQGIPVHWHVIDSAESARAFADKLAEAPPNRAYRTSISGGLLFSAKYFERNPNKGPRRVIDISGDGPNNQGHAVTWARDQVVAQGIGINGLPLVLKTPSNMSIDVNNLEEYYRECVVGGQGAFVIAVGDKSQFTDAIRTKLILEIAGLEPSPRFIRTQDKPVNCMVGEKIWRDRYGESGPDWQ